MSIKELELVIKNNERKILDNWIDDQLNRLARQKDLISDEDLRIESQGFLNEFVKAIKGGDMNPTAASFKKINELLKKISLKRAQLGFTPSETATFIFSLKNSLLPAIREHYSSDPDKMFNNIKNINDLLDKLGLKTFEHFLIERERVILIQSETLLELSSPIVKLWDNILAVPIIGILDSKRTQTIMENLLKLIVDTGSRLSIIDITGVSIVDTQVANHILKTVSAVKLLGAEAIITGIRPEVAQTIVNLGLDLKDITTRATLADGLTYAFNLLKYKVINASVQ